MTLEAVSFGEFASLVGVSEPTLRKRLPDAPEGVVLSRGRNGEAYQIDPRAGVAWWKSTTAAVEAERAARVESLGKLQLELLGEDTALGGHDVEGLSPAEQGAQLDAELKAIRLSRERGELVRAVDVEATAGVFMALVKERNESIVDRLRKRVDVPPDVAEALDRLVQRDLHELADAAARIGDPTGEAEEGATADRAV